MGKMDKIGKKRKIGNAKCYKKHCFLQWILLIFNNLSVHFGDQIRDFGYQIQDFRVEFEILKRIKI